MVLCCWHVKKPTHVRLADPFKSSVLNSLRNVKRPVRGRAVMQETPKVLLLELKFYGKLEMYVNNKTCKHAL